MHPTPNCLTAWALTDLFNLSLWITIIFHNFYCIFFNQMHPTPNCLKAWVLTDLFTLSLWIIIIFHNFYCIFFNQMHPTPNCLTAWVLTDLFTLSWQKLTKLGQFRVKDELPSSGANIQPGSLFFSRDSGAKASTGLKGNAHYSNNGNCL